MTIAGIDLGTTNSLIAVWADGASELIPNALGEVLTPSAVAVDDSGTVLVGRPALDHSVAHPAAAATVFKRAMGSERTFMLRNRKFRAEELSAIVLRQLIEDANAHLADSGREPIASVVISVPAYFNDSQRKATQDAARIAGVSTSRLINEPTAAAMAHGIHAKYDERTIVVVDLGGGTLDVSMLEFFSGVMEVHATAGDNFLGGEDFDTALVKHCLRKSLLSESDLGDEQLRRFRRQIKHARHQLTTAQSVDIEFTKKNRLRKDTQIELTISRADFEQCCQPLTKRLREAVERALLDAQKELSEIDDVILVGGATRMPLVGQMVGRLLRRLPYSELNPDEAVAMGAAVQGALISRAADLEDRVLTDVCPYTLGIEIAEIVDGRIRPGYFLPVIPRNTAIPVSRVETVSPMNARQKTVNCRVFQGESRHVRNNVLLGEFDVTVTEADHVEGIDVRFTYDSNGTLEVSISRDTNDVGQTEVLNLGGPALSDAQIAEALKKLAHLKTHPRKDARNMALLARGERLWEERLHHRGEIGAAMQEFETMLASQDLAAC